MLCLPDDILFVIFSYCDKITLRKLCQVCKRFRYLASSDYLWSGESRKCLATNQLSNGILFRSCNILSGYDKCRISLNWRRKQCHKICLKKQSTKYLPWLQMQKGIMWVSKGENVLGFHRQVSGFLSRKPIRVLKGHNGDVCRFVLNNDIIVSGGSDGSIISWSGVTGDNFFNSKESHISDINAIDFSSNVIVSGSRDRTLKLWSWSEHHLIPELSSTISLQDRVWSVALDLQLNSFLCGTGGCKEHPLSLYDLTKSRLICKLGNNYNYGAGVLHCVYETPQSALTCGYDTYIRQWDLRSGDCVTKWENPYDLAVYCLSTDQNFTILSGSSSHGLVWLWDKRSTRPVQMYYVGKENSPVYSVTFDPCHLYVALDKSLHLLKFD